MLPPLRREVDRLAPSSSAGVFDLKGLEKKPAILSPMSPSFSAIRPRSKFSGPSEFLTGWRGSQSSTLGGYLYTFYAMPISCTRPLTGYFPYCIK